MSSARTILNTFDQNSLPDLDTAVMGALELFMESPQQGKIQDAFKRPIVIGSGNARATGEILFAKSDAVFADESSFKQVLERSSDIDGAILISASGGKHAISIAEYLHHRHLDAVLLTNNPEAPAKEYFTADAVVVFPKNREPYTYNTSTYLGMILARTNEDPASIKTYIESAVAPILRDDFGEFDAFTFILPAHLGLLAPMVRTKFDELFGPFITGRVFTEEEIKHAKTVVSSHTECFIALGALNEHYGLQKNRVSVPLPPQAGYGALVAISYYLVGAIQKQHPPYFKNNIVEYTEAVSEIFGQKIGPIVE